MVAFTKRASKRRSLAEQLADLANPKPADFDPEDSAYDDGTRATDYTLDDHDYSGDDTLQAPSSLRVASADIELDKSFKGRVVSRRDLDEESEDNDDDDEEDHTDENEEIASAISDDDNYGGEKLQHKAGGGHLAEDSDMSEEKEGEEEGTSGPSEEDEEDDPADSDIDRQMQELEESDRTFLFRATKASENDLRKAEHTRNQRVLWEDFLEVRVRMQKLLYTGNRLPQGETHVFFREADAALKNSFEKAQRSIAGLVEDFIELEHILLSRNPEIKSPSTEKDALLERSKGRKRKLDCRDEEVWDELCQLESDFQEYRDETIDKWSKKTQLSSGTIMNKKFKALNQSVMAQVDAVLADTDRFRRRAFAKVSQYKVFGREDEVVSEEKAQVTPEDDDDEVAEHGSRRRQERLDEEVYDDTDFYHQLLKEFIESGSTGLEEEAKALRVKVRKPKKEIDRRASKGRKIRYVVHPKIQNFMYPRPATEPAIDIDELYASLFGQRKGQQR